METARRNATWDDLLKLPEDVKAELVDGEIVFHPSPLPDHQYIIMGLERQLAPLTPRRGGVSRGRRWLILYDVDVRLDERMIVRPDLAGWHHERLPSPWGRRPQDVVPDWTLEVLSPSNARHDLVRKRALYARAGVRHYWLIDPTTQTLTALALQGERWAELGAWDETAVARIAPFEEVEIDVGALFPPPPDEVHEP